MTVTIKTPDDIEKMRIAGRLAAEVLEMIGEHIKPGVTTEEPGSHLPRLYRQRAEGDSRPAELQLAFPSRSAPRSTMVCHGIPNEKPLKEGDILNVDITVRTDHGDTSKMFLVGKTPEWADRLRQITQECMYKGISVCPGAHLGDIGEIIQKHAERTASRWWNTAPYRRFHEEGPPHGRAGTGIELKEGMIFTIEPMINQGRPETRLLGDGWTAITKDRKLSAQWEHTVLVTADGYEILTLRNDETFPRTSAA